MNTSGAWFWTLSSIFIENGPILEIAIFSDASTYGVCPVTRTIIYQPNKVSQNLTTSKPRLANKNVSIPLLEFISSTYVLQISRKHKEQSKQI